MTESKISYSYGVVEQCYLVSQNRRIKPKTCECPKPVPSHSTTESQALFNILPYKYNFDPYKVKTLAPKSILVFAK